MASITDLKVKLGIAKCVKTPSLTIDLSLADTGDIQPDTEYVGRIVSARLINPIGDERTPKIDICIEILNENEERIGAINDYLYLSVRSLRRLKEFLLSAGMETEANSKTLDAGALCESLPGKMVTLTTRAGLTPRGKEIIEVASYIVFEADAETEKVA
jgi:hypothetical protein